MTLPPADPADIGLDAARLEMIRERAQGWIDAGDVHRTLVLLVARHGQVGFHSAFGVDGPEDDAAPLRTDALFPLYSQTKSITASLVMSLVEDGLIGLSRPVQEYLPEFVGERKDQVLVQHLLTHTSGLADNDLLEAFGRTGLHLLVGDDGSDTEHHPWERVFLELAYTWPVAHAPSQVLRYSNLGYILLGEIARRTSGKTLDELGRDRLFDPLGMSDSWFCAPPDAELGRLVRRGNDSADWPFESEEGRGCLGGAGAAYSTTGDLAAFTQLFIDGGRNREGDVVLAPHTVERMTTNQVGDIPSEAFGTPVIGGAYGLGWFVETPRSILAGWPKPPDGSIQHGGFGLVHPWADVSQDLVGVFCSVADRFRPGGSTPIDLMANHDLFVQMVTTSTVD